MTEIHACGNFISNLRELSNLKKIQKLIILDITANEASKIQDFRLYLIYYLTKLRVLNRIAIEKPELLASKDFFDGRLTPELLEVKLVPENTIDVTELDLSHCKLKDFENIFHSNNFPKVKKMILNKNLFSNFKIFGNLPNLTHLYLNYNVFERIYNKLEKPLINKGILGLSVNKIFNLEFGKP